MRKVLVGILFAIISIMFLGQAAYAVTLTGAILKVSSDGLGDYKTISAAHTAAVDGDIILVSAGKSSAPASFAGAQITKAVNLIGVGGPVIATAGYTLPGTALKVGFFIPDNAPAGISISGFTFKNLDMAVYATNATSLMVADNTILSPVQGITIWNGDSCTVTNNRIKGGAVPRDACLRTYLSGGGLGIFIGERNGGPASQKNVVMGNNISGVVNGGNANSQFWAAGICLFGEAGGASNQLNDIYYNTVQLSSRSQVKVADVALVQMDALPTCVVTNNRILANTLGHAVIFPWAVKLGQTPDGLSSTCTNTVIHNLSAGALAAEQTTGEIIMVKPY